MLSYFNHVITTATETFITLRRDQIFYPALFSTVAIFILASYIAEWSVDDWRIIFFNFSQTMFRITGDILALLFGSKILQDARSDGSVETALSRPITRGAWVTGKYIGLAFCLILFGVLAGLAWKTIDVVFVIDTPNTLLFWGILLALCEWLVVASIAIFFSTLGSFGSAIFSASSLWVLGLLSGALTSSFLSTDEESFTMLIIRKISLLWNFDRFTIIHYSRNMINPELSFLSSSALYGISLCIFFLMLSTLAIRSRDLVK